MNSKLLLLLPLLLLQSGCSSFGEGLARGLVNRETEDTRQCYVRGPSFDGIEQLIDATTKAGPKQGGDVKVLMVHGIGTHLPGYSTRLAENLARELNLDVVERTPKIIKLRLHVHPQVFEEAVSRGMMRGEPDENNGTVTLQRYSSKDGIRRMTFYELTWSEITEPDKRVINYDSSGTYSFRRAALNHELKEFINNYLPDPLIYLGDAQGNIQTAVSQTLCWMFTRDYEQVPQQTDEACEFFGYTPDDLRNDSYVFISHSLGSRILTDTLQTVTATVAYGQGEKSDETLKVATQWVDTLQNEPLSIFMLSNQLPLLQLGRPAPMVTNQFPDYCTPEGDNKEGRVFAESRIVAFSDPNDILSWSVPPGYEDQYLDSRMCPVLTNVIINVAEVKKVFGFELAPAGEAHRNYDNDERVIKLMAHGMSEDKADPLIKERCEWMEVR
ncbi:MAG: hypothetical protein GY875_23665 [Gammaproteobacteria bacterium]|nr:hypothetical protein [Gammaproteobacteria bacterium]